MSDHKVRKGNPPAVQARVNRGPQPYRANGSPARAPLGSAGSPRPSLRPRPAPAPLCPPCARGLETAAENHGGAGRGTPKRVWRLESLRFSVGSARAVGEEGRGSGKRGRVALT